MRRGKATVDHDQYSVPCRKYSCYHFRWITCDSTAVPLRYWRPHIQRSTSLELFERPCHAAVRRHRMAGVKYVFVRVRKGTPRTRFCLRLFLLPSCDSEYTPYFIATTDTKNAELVAPYDPFQVYCSLTFRRTFSYGSCALSETPRVGLSSSVDGLGTIDSGCRESLRESGFGTRVGKFTRRARPKSDWAAGPRLAMLPMLPMLSEMERSSLFLFETRSLCATYLIYWRLYKRIVMLFRLCLPYGRRH